MFPCLAIITDLEDTELEHQAAYVIAIYKAYEIDSTIKDIIKVKQEGAR